MENNLLLYLIIILPVAAFFYASVGHGGASSYLMILTLAGFAPEEIRPTALLLNSVVALVAFSTHYLSCVFPKKLFMQLILFSVPFAFIGGSVIVDSTIYRNVLGVILLFPIMQFMGLFPIRSEGLMEKAYWMPSLLGLAIGFLSGLIGIGGGIILSPILLMLGWTNVRQTAALSALFIFVNSIAGYLGTVGPNLIIDKTLGILIPFTVLGGTLGGYFGSCRFTPRVVKHLLTLVLTGAAMKLILS